MFRCLRTRGLHMRHRPFQLRRGHVDLRNLCVSCGLHHGFTVIMKRMKSSTALYVSGEIGSAFRVSTASFSASLTVRLPNPFWNKHFSHSSNRRRQLKPLKDAKPRGNASFSFRPSRRPGALEPGGQNRRMKQDKHKAAFNTKRKTRITKLLSIVNAPARETRRVTFMLVPSFLLDFSRVTSTPARHQPTRGVSLAWSLAIASCSHITPSASSSKSSTLVSM